MGSRDAVDCGIWPGVEGITKTSMRSNIVLIDFENIQPASLELLAPDNFRVLLFVGANQTKLSFEIVASMQKLGERAEYVKMAGNGANALDFHIAYYIGVLSAADPSAYFHIVSKDTGFDPLIQHLKSKKIWAGRVNAIPDIPALKIANCKSAEERVQIVSGKLTHPNGTKPRTLKTLRSWIASQFQKLLSEQEITAVVTGLVKVRVISVDDTKVVYAPVTSD